MIPLDQLGKGKLATIESIDNNQLPLKLIEMGCLPGNNISLVHKAPFNDPLYFKIDESHLAIRRETAKHIFVRLIK